MKTALYGATTAFSKEINIKFSHVTSKHPKIAATLLSEVNKNEWQSLYGLINLIW